MDNQLKEHERRFALPKQRRQVASHSELFTIALVGELVAQPCESVWYWLVGQSYRHLFPKLPDYSRYHRVVRNAEKVWAALALALVDNVAAALMLSRRPWLRVNARRGRGA